MRRALTVSLLLCLSAAPGFARREVRPPGPERARFLGPHPVAARLGGGYCYLDTPHVHAYGPDRPALYQRVGEDYVFTGDPVPFGYEGPRTTYYGHHPVVVAADLGYAPPRPLYCAIRGPHYHPYQPPEAPGYVVRDNVVFYVGPMDPEFMRVRPQMERVVEAEYRPFVAVRPQVSVTAAPPGWAGELWVVPPPAPAVTVSAPAPRVHVVAPAAPSVHVVAPAAPSVHLYAPAPPSVVITPPSPPGIIVAPPVPGAVIIHGGHPGKHKGWYKHGRGRH